MSNKKQGSLIAKIFFWGIELFGGLCLWVVLSEGWRMLTEDGEIFVGPFFTIFGLYLCSIIVNVLVWMFNILHRFNDFDGFRDMLSGLSVAPLLLVKHILIHFVRILGQIFGFGPSKASSTKKSPFTSNSSQINTTFSTEIPITKKEFQHQVEKKVWEIVTYTHPEDYPSQGVYTKWWTAPTIRVHWGTVKVIRCIVFECKYDIEEWVIDDCIEKLANEIESEVEDAIKSLASMHQMNCGNWDINVEIEYRIS